MDRARMEGDHKVNDISEIKIAIDKANREMYEAFSSGHLDVAVKQAIIIEKRAIAAKWSLGKMAIEAPLK